jgi:mannitol/fructose-specific phosphotransferase system IIA component (Ntr-type)
MKFADFICFEASLPQLELSERDEAITALVQSLDQAGKLGDGLCQELTQAVIDRENEASTGMGKGVAVPHVKHPLVKEVVGAVGQCAQGIDFSALDKQLVFSMVLILSPAGNPDKHLQAMEGVFKHLQYEKFRKFLRQANSAELIEDLLREADENPSWM